MPIIKNLKSLFKKVLSKFKFESSPSIDLSNWAVRLLFYFFIYFCLIVLYIPIFSNLGLFYNNDESARYMLSALVQSEAAIIAIVITLSLVAVQLAAQSYSARIAEIFQNAPDFWILIITYIIAMIYGLGILKMIDGNCSGLNPYINIEGHVSFSYLLGIFAFIAIIPYIYNTLNLLKPSNVIRILSGRITGRNILSAIGEKPEKNYEIDPILPIIDFIRGSLMRYDSETIIIGLRAIENRINLIFQEDTIEKDDKEKILKHTLVHFSRVGNLAMSKDYERIAIEIVDILYRNAKTASAHELDGINQSIITLLEDVEKTAGNHDLNDTKQHAADYIKKLQSDPKSNQS